MKRLVLASVVVLSSVLGGCASTMSQATSSVSQFDGAQTIQAREMPAFGKDKWHPSNVFFGARWLDKSPNTVVLEVKFMHDYQNLKSLSFNVDGELFDAHRLDVATDLERNQYYKASNAPFVVTLDQAKKILGSQNAKFRLTTLSAKYIDGAIVLNGDKSMAYKSIENVVKAIP